MRKRRFGRVTLALLCSGLTLASISNTASAVRVLHPALPKGSVETRQLARSQILQLIDDLTQPLVDGQSRPKETEGAVMALLRALLDRDHLPEWSASGAPAPPVPVPAAPPGAIPALPVALPTKVPMVKATVSPPPTGGSSSPLSAFSGTGVRKPAKQKSSAPSQAPGRAQKTGGATKRTEPEGGTGANPPLKTKAPKRAPDVLTPQPRSARSAFPNPNSDDEERLKEIFKRHFGDASAAFVDVTRVCGEHNASGEKDRAVRLILRAGRLAGKISAEYSADFALAKAKSAKALAEARGWKTSIASYEQLIVKFHTALQKREHLKLEDVVPIHAELDQAIAEDNARWEDEMRDDARLLEQIFSEHSEQGEAAYAAVREISSAFRKVGEVARDQRFSERSVAIVEQLGQRFRAQYGVARANFNRSIIERHGAAWNERASLYREIVTRYEAVLESEDLYPEELRSIDNALQVLLDSDKATWERQLEEDAAFAAAIFDRCRKNSAKANSEFRERFYTYQREFQTERAIRFRVCASNLATRFGVQWVADYYSAGARLNVEEAEAKRLGEVAARWREIVRRYGECQRVKPLTFELLNTVRNDDKALLEETGPSLWKIEEVSPDVVDNAAFPPASGDEEYWLSGKVEVIRPPRSPSVEESLPDPRSFKAARKKK